MIFHTVLPLANLPDRCRGHPVSVVPSSMPSRRSGGGRRTFVVVGEMFDPQLAVWIFSFLFVNDSLTDLLVVVVPLFFLLPYIVTPSTGPAWISVPVPMGRALSNSFTRPPPLALLPDLHNPLNRILLRSVLHAHYNLLSLPEILHLLIHPKHRIALEAMCLRDLLTRDLDPEVRIHFGWRET